MSQGSLRPVSRKSVFSCLVCSLLLLSSTSVSAAGNTSPPAKAPAKAMHGIAMHGTLKYPPGFTHFDYVNPDAPKSGVLREGVVSSGFDSLNPFILKGIAAAGVSEYLYDTLTTKSADEAFSEYGLIAESIEMPDDRSSVIFNINPKAKFSDGQPITARDVEFSFTLLREKGHPFFKSYYADVSAIRVISPLRIEFAFGNTSNRELPLILGQIPILPQHYWKDRDFTKTSMEPPVGSGPYRLGKIDAGRSITFERNKDYWAADLPVNRGKYNFDQVMFEYFLDETIALEAFKAGQYDFRAESTAKVWATAYIGPRFDSGEIIKEAIAHQMPVGMQSFLYNTRRDIFQDRRTRQALAYAFDFEWTNRQLFFGQYTRTRSYFDNSELASTGLPSADELKILESFRKQLPQEVFEKEYRPPGTDGSGNLRTQLRQAMNLLKEAGWEVRDGVMTNAAGKPLQFEILLRQKEFERVVLPFVQNLAKLGITATIRLVDSTQYVERVRSFDYDMIVQSQGQSDSPGNEQRDYWLAETAKINGSRNYAGVSDPVVDTLVERIIQAPDRQSLITLTHALDRVLLWGHYVIPHWHLATQRVAYWNYLQRPGVTPRSGVDLNTWWMKR